MRHIKLYIFFYFTATMLLQATYITLDRVASGYPSQWPVTLLRQATGYYGALLPLLFILWSAHRVPFRLSVAPIAWHSAAFLSFSILHTCWNRGTRLILFPVFDLGRYDYGRMPLRFFMEAPVPPHPLMVSGWAHTRFTGTGNTPTIWRSSWRQLNSRLSPGNCSRIFFFQRFWSARFRV